MLAQKRCWTPDAGSDLKSNRTTFSIRRPASLLLVNSIHKSVNEQKAAKGSNMKTRILISMIFAAAMTIFLAIASNVNASGQRAKDATDSQWEYLSFILSA
jgi:hypothetical protein